MERCVQGVGRQRLSHVCLISYVTAKSPSEFWRTNGRVAPQPWRTAGRFRQHGLDLPPRRLIPDPTVVWMINLGLVASEL